MYRQTGTATVALTPEFAKEFSALPVLKGDRDRESKAGKKRIRWLHQKLTDGLFYSPDWATATLNGVTHRVNGGHSSLMLSECNGDFPRGMSVTIKQFHCDTESDLLDLFAQFDAKGSARTGGDIINVHKSVEDRLQSIPRSVVERAVTGIVCSYKMLDPKFSCTDSEKYGLVHEHGEFIAWCHTYLGADFLCRSYTVAVMFLTFNKNAEAASEFWSLVKDDSHPDRDNPTRVLSRFLREVSLKTPLKRKSVTRWDARALFVKCIHAWNSWRAGEGTNLNYFAKAEIPDIR